MAMIYGVDTEQPLSPHMVRDALVDCYFQAHCQQTDLALNQNVALNREYCTQIVKKAFNQTHGDFDAPTKASLTESMNYLANFSAPFRNPEIIRQHAAQIQQLVSLLPE